MFASGIVAPGIDVIMVTGLLVFVFIVPGRMLSFGGTCFCSLSMSLSHSEEGGSRNVVDADTNAGPKDPRDGVLFCSFWEEEL